MKIVTIILVLGVLGSTATAREKSTETLLIAGVDANGNVHTVNAGSSGTPWLKDLVKRARLSPPLSPEMRARGCTGVFRMVIDLKTGKVRKVETVVTSGFREVDIAAKSSMYEWRWQPGTWQQIDVPVTILKRGEVLQLPPGTVLPKHL